jgi:hypothetical protein
MYMFYCIPLLLLIFSPSIPSPQCQQPLPEHRQRSWYGPCAAAETGAAMHAGEEGTDDPTRPSGSGIPGPTNPAPTTTTTTTQSGCQRFWWPNANWKSAAATATHVHSINAANSSSSAIGERGDKQHCYARINLANKAYDIKIKLLIKKGILLTDWIE